MEKVIPTKSLNDSKSYLALKLANGLKLLLVSDMDCDKAAASVSVGTGSMSDPDDLPGLAHLNEHLLSVENDHNNSATPEGRKPFNQFIAENGGLFNAFTTRDQTNFHFDVDPKVFPEAIKRFAKFFTKTPTFTEDHLNKEIAIVDAEHLSKVNRDAWRKMAVEASSAKRSHPFYKFTTGNKKTLLEIPKEKGIDVLKAAKNFRSKYYVSRLITVVVYGKDSIENLENLCLPLFSQVPDSDKKDTEVELPQWKEWPYGEEELKMKIDIVPVADIKDFYMVFPIENTRPLYKTFPHGYILRLLGNRGPGSLYFHLYEKHWVEFCHVNSAIPARGFGEISIGFQLTKIGLEHIDEIILFTFQYLKMMKEKGPQKYFWEEMQKISLLQFDNQDKDNPVEYTQRIANLLHVYPLKDVLTVGSVINEFKPDVIQRFMNYLEPDNCRIITVCRCNGEKNENFLQDHWYGAKYTVTKFSEEQLQIWKNCDVLECFRLPKPNKYIPAEFDLKCGKIYEKQSWISLSPKLLLDSDFAKAWFSQDGYFQLAKGVIRFELFSPLPMTDPILFNLNQIWFLTMKNILNEEFHQATVAGSYHEIKPTINGVEVTVSGFSHKLIVLMAEIFQRIINSHEEEQMKLIANYFPSVKDRYFTGLMNSKNLLLQNVNNYYLSLLLRERRFSNEELLEAINDATEERLFNYIKLFFFRPRLEWFTYGNFMEKETDFLINACLKYLKSKWDSRPLLSCQNQRLREVCITEGKNFIFHGVSNQSGNSCSLLIQSGLLNLRESLILEIIDQIIFQPFFTQLRSTEQIGYIVRTSIRKSNGCQALLIFVQGDKPPSYMSERIFKAVDNVEKLLNDMNENEFSQHKKAVRVRKVDQPKTMLILFNKLWNNEIYTRRYDFKRLSKELDEMDKITLNEVRQFFQEHVSNTSTKRKTLQVHLLKRIRTESNSSNTQEFNNDVISSAPNVSVISDVIAWKAAMDLYSTKPC